MKNRGFIPVFLLLIAISAAARTAGDEVRSFGADSGPVIAIIADGASFSALETHFLAHPPTARVALVPRIAEKAYASDVAANATAVIVLSDSPDGVTTVYPGSRGRTSPAWLLSAAGEILDESNVAWNVDETRMTLYRLGWTRDNPRLAAWLDGGIPAIQIASRSLTPELIGSIASRASASFRPETDSHYLVIPFRSRHLILSETAMVALMIVASAVIMFFLFVFSFLLGKKSDQRLRDFFRVCWLPFIYFAVNLVSLALAQGAVSSIVSLRLGSASAWALIPVTSFAAKVGVSWFIGALVLSLNQLIKFPEDGFIYGYIASIVCLVNVFAFAALDFSLSVLFLSAYLLSIAIARLKHPLAQALGIALLAVPFLPYCAALAVGPAGEVSSYLAPLYRGEDFWNARLALVAMPPQFLAARLAHTLGVFGKRTKWYLPVNAFVALAAALLAVGALAFMPPFSNERPLVASVVETITGTESSLSVSTPIAFPDLSLEKLPANAERPSLERDSGRIAPVTAKARPYLDRQLVTITVAPALPYDRADIEIAGDGFISVLDSSEAFELRNAGSVSFFSHEIPEGAVNPEPWTVSFSAPSDENLTATVRVVSRENPWGLTAVNDGVKTDYRLEAVSVALISGKKP